MGRERPDAAVVGSGPNGLAAAVELARRGLRVELVEGASELGGACRTEELTLPGFRHDTCATVHALVAHSPFFATIDLAARGVEMLRPPVAVAHPLDDGRAAVVQGGVDETATTLRGDAGAYRRVVGSFVEDADALFEVALGPVLRRWPANPLAAARFGVVGALPATQLVRQFVSDEARALVGGVAAHAARPLSAPLTSGFALTLLGAAHLSGWPVARGGSGTLVTALREEFEAAGGTVRTGCWITDLAEVPADVVLLDTTPRALAAIVGSRLGSRERRALRRFRHGPGVCKVDWALREPVPWTAEACRRAGTVHVGGRFEEVAAAEAAVAAGRHPERPFCLVVQPTVVDTSRAPSGRHVLWAYCHVPHGSPVDLTEAIESQIERFAPGFRDVVLARTTTVAADRSDTNPNLVGGDISGGLATLRQTVARPTARWHPYRTGLDGVYLCSASTPPGGGVHGMCGYLAALDAIDRVRRG